MRGELIEDVGIVIVEPGDLTKADKRWLDDHFMPHVFPVLTPLAIDPAHPFPFIPNLGLSLWRSSWCGRGDRKTLNALVRLPQKIERFVRAAGARRRRAGARALHAAGDADRASTRRSCSPAIR